VTWCPGPRVTSPVGGAASAAGQPADITYGSNPAAGNTFVSNGTRRRVVRERQAEVSAGKQRV
jgi:hypothetical protein